MADVRWEIEYPGLRLDGDQVAWTMKNVSDEEATSGSPLGKVTIHRRQIGEAPIVDTTPFTNDITLDRDVAGGTAHPMTYPLTWAGQEAGSYTVSVMPHSDVYAEMAYGVDGYGSAVPDNF